MAVHRDRGGHHIGHILPLLAVAALLTAAAASKGAPDPASGSPGRLANPTGENPAYVPFERRADAPYTGTVQTPVAWKAKPLPGGPVRLFAIPSVQYGRELVELAQRLDIRYGVVTWDRQWDQNTWGLGDHYGQRGHRFDFAKMQQYLTMELAGPNKYDVYLIRTPLGWKWFPEAARSALLQRVKDGAGLVLVQPFAGDDKADVSDLWSISPLVDCASDTMDPASGYMKPASQGLVKGEKWQVAQPDHYITKNLPLDLLPFAAMSYQKYSISPHAEVLIQSQSGDPIVAVGHYGKGRVVTLAYRAFDMTPYVDQPEGSPPPVDYAYWEVGYALVGRCVLWAAGRDTPIRIPEEFVQQAKAGRINPIVLRVRDTVQYGQKIRVRAYLKDEKRDWHLESAELRDGYGRTIEHVDLTRETTAYLPTSRVSTLAAKVVVNAANGQGQRISRSSPVILKRLSASWDDYQVIMWPNDRLPWQRPMMYDQMRRWGCTATLDPHWSNDALMRERLINNMQIVPHGLRRQVLHQNPDAFAKQKQQYDETGDKKYLQRFVCISDSSVREREGLSLWKIAVRLAHAQAAGLLHRRGGFADELSRPAGSGLCPGCASQLSKVPQEGVQRQPRCPEQALGHEIHQLGEGDAHDRPGGQRPRQLRPLG